MAPGRVGLGKGISAPGRARVGDVQVRLGYMGTFSCKLREKCLIKLKFGLLTPPFLSAIILSGEIRPYDPPPHVFVGLNVQ